MDKRLIFSFVLVVLFSSVFVFALTLLREVPVASCTDSDGGLNVNITGTISGATLNGTNFTRTDYCGTNITLIEFACFNSTLAQEWSENCNCSSGRCV